MREYNLVGNNTQVNSFIEYPSVGYKYICSPMNYIGGKYKLLPQLLPLFPQNIETFVDLFCGGCNVGINVQAEKYIFNDNLSYLIDLYRSFYLYDTKFVMLHVQRCSGSFFVMMKLLY